MRRLYTEAELEERTAEAREKLENTIARFYVKYIPKGDGSNLTIHTWRPAKPDELRAIKAKTRERAEVLADGMPVRRIELLTAELWEMAAGFAEEFREADTAIPAAMRLRLDAEIDGFVADMMDELYEQLRISFITARPPELVLNDLGDVLEARAARLFGRARLHHGYFSEYLLLKGYELAGHERFRFVVNEKETTCEICLSQKDRVYTADDLAQNGMFPPLHPNCGCYIATMDGERLEAGEANGGAILRSGGGGATDGGGAGRRDGNATGLTDSLIDAFIEVVDRIPAKYYLQALVGRDFENSVLSKDERLEKLRQGLYRSSDAFESLPYATSMMGDISIIAPIPGTAARASDMFKGRGNGLNSVDDIVNDPKALYGKTKADVAKALGDGWTEKTYGSAKTGWEFYKGDQRITYHPGGGRHGGAYYSYSSGATGRIKIVGSDYILLPGDKATILYMK